MMSSAYSNKYMFIEPMSIICRHLADSFVSRSFKDIENKNGERYSPCLTPIFDENGSPRHPLCFTLDLTLLYTWVLYCLTFYRGRLYLSI